MKTDAEKQSAKKYLSTHREKRRAWERSYYARNKEKFASKQYKKYRLNRDWIIAYKLKHPCVDCGETDPIVLDFDHRDPKTKLKGVATLVVCGIALQRVIEEVAKCDVRCANCHRRKTARERCI